MTARTQVGQLQVATQLFDFVNQQALPGTGLDTADFWAGVEALIHELAPVNKALVEKREVIQQQIDEWHKARQGQAHDAEAYKAFLQSIGYLLPEPETVQVRTENVDDEVARIAGPQLVVPVMNARFALNAANARWGSLYNALYGTDAISDQDGAAAGAQYNPVRGQKVIYYAKGFLNENFPLAAGSHADVTAYSVVDGGLSPALADASQFAGFRGDAASPEAVLLVNNGLHVEIQIDRNNQIGSADPAGVKDLLMESALTAIMDCEDSIAAVDAEDKVQVYRNWLGLMAGNLTEQVTKGGQTFTRALNQDREYTAADGSKMKLPGR